MNKIKVYSTDSCPFCYSLMDWLDSINVEYEEIDASNIPGITSVPITFIGDDDKIIGFDRPAILKSLKAHNIPFSI